MSEQTTIEATGPVKVAKDDTTYVVQAQREVGVQITPDSDALEWIDAWVDIATVTVPHRTPRKIVFRQALKQADLKPRPDVEPLRLRALDAASAAEQTVEARQPDPEWVI